MPWGAAPSYWVLLFSHSVVSNSLQLRGWQHTRLPCPSLSPRVVSNLCPLSRRYHPIISPSVIPFSCLQTFPVSGSFPVSQLYASGGQRSGASAKDLDSISSNEYSGLISFRIDWFDIFAVQGTLKGLLQHYSTKTSILQCSSFFIVQLSHLYMTTGKNIAMTRQTFVGKVMSLLFNMLSRLVIALFSKQQASLNFMAAVTICSDFGALPK